MQSIANKRILPLVITKTFATRIRLIQFKVQQVRGDLDFHPNTLKQGIRSEQALMALAEMYVQCVSACKVSAIVKQFCGHSVSSAQAS